MFLKTWIQMYMERHNCWGESIEFVENELNCQRTLMPIHYEEFQKDHHYMDRYYWPGFYKVFKENMERKKDEK